MIWNGCFALYPLLVMEKLRRPAGHSVRHPPCERIPAKQDAIRTLARCLVADAVVEANPESSRNEFQTIAGPIHTAIVLIILTAVAMLGYFSIHNRSGVRVPNHLFFYLPTIAWEWIVFGYVYWGVRRHGKTFRDIAGERWKGATDFLRDLAIAFCSWIVAIVVLNVVSRLLHASGSLEAARRLAPQGALESVVWIALATTAGICEETIFRGYLQRQFVAWFRNVPLGVLLSAMLFGAGHIYQGARPAVVIAVFGLIFGILAEARKNLRPGMMMHAWQDGISGFLVRLVPK